MLDVVILSILTTPQRRRPLEGFRVSGVCQGSNCVPVNTDAVSSLDQYLLFQSFRSVIRSAATIMCRVSALLWFSGVYFFMKGQRGKALFT